MIKGVNRQVVEVNETDCDYFERILFFVKPEYASISEGKIRERAGIIAGRTDKAPPTKVRGSRTTAVLKIVLSVLGGLVAGLIIARVI
ncbi:MAG: hypothetical protein IJB74_08390 [Clostridia bacterium]|nr:hypothetical protein [Clostridia bacterium]